MVSTCAGAMMPRAASVASATERDCISRSAAVMVVSAGSSTVQFSDMTWPGGVISESS